MKIPLKYSSILLIQWFLVNGGWFIYRCNYCDQVKQNLSRQYFDFNKTLLIFLLIVAPTIINLVGNKYTTSVNKTIMFVILTAFTLLYLLAAKKGKHFNEVRFSPKSSDF